MDQKEKLASQKDLIVKQNEKITANNAKMDEKVMEVPEEFRDSEEQLSLLYNNKQEYISLFNVEKDGRFVLKSLNTPLLNKLQSIDPSLKKELLIELDLAALYRSLFRYSDKKIEDRLSIYQKVVKDKRCVEYQREISLVNNPKSSFHLFTTLNPILDHNGECTHILMVSNDISEKIKAEKELKESEFILKETQQMAHLGYWQWEIANNIVTWSDQLYHIYGLDEGSYKPSFEGYLERIHPEDMERVKEIIQDAVVSKKSFQFEERIIKPDGEVRHLTSWGRLISDEEGTPLKMIGACQDVTEKALAEQKLKESEQKLSVINENSPDLLTTIDEKFDILYMNRVLEGFKMEDVLGSNILNFVPENYHEQYEQHLHKTFAGEKQEFEMEAYGEHGQKAWYAVRMSPLMKSDKVTSLLITSSDITWRKKAEETILNQKERLTLATEAAHLGIWDWHIKNNILIWDDSMYDLYGIKERSFMRTYEAWVSAFHPDDKIRCDVEIQLALNGERNFDTEFRIVWPDNSVHHMRSIGSVIRDNQGIPTRMIGVNWDITEKKQSEEKLLRSEKNLRLIYDTTNDVLFQLKVEPNDCFRFMSVNKAFLQATGIAEDQIIGKTIKEIIPEPSYSLVLEKYREAIREKRLVEWEETTKYPAGELTGEVSVSPIFDNDGNCVHLIGSVHDITERKKADLLLKRSKDEIQKQLQHNQLILESTLDGYVMMDANTKIVDVNDAYCKLTGYSREELLKMDIYTLEKEFSQTKIKERVECVSKNGQARFEITHTQKDGAFIHLDAKLNLIQIDNESRVIAFVRDITAQKKAQQELEYRFNFEKLLAKASTQFINHPLDNLEEVIDTFLVNICEFIGFDYSSSMLFSFGDITSCGYYKWCDQSAKCFKGQFQNISSKTSSWEIEKLRNNENLFLNKRNDLPKEAEAFKAILENLGIQSLIQIPLVSQRKVIGFISFESTKVIKTWPKDIEVLLRFAGEMITNVLERQKGEKALKESKQRLSLIYNYNTDFIFLLKCSPNNRLILESINHSALEFIKRSTGVSDDLSVIGLEYREFLETFTKISKEELNKRIEIISKVVKEKERAIFTSHLITTLGDRELIFENIVSPIIKNGHCVQILYIVKDITEKEKAKEELIQSEKLMSSIFNGTKDQMAIFHIEDDGNIILEQVNQTFNNTWEIAGIDLDPEKLYGKDVDHFNRVAVRLSEEKIKERRELLDYIITSKKAINFEEEYLALNDKKYDMDVTISPLLNENGKCDKLLLVTRDISFKKKANEQLISKILETEDRERKRISKELHDGLGQNLTTASLNLNYLENAIMQMGDSHKIKFQNGIKFLDTAIKESRNIAHNLMPQSITDFGYVETIESLVEDLNNTTGTTFSFYNNLKGERLLPYQELSLFRITQEAINNILKYAEASKVTLQLMKYHDLILLTIEDNGKGFDIEKVGENSFGLNSIKARINALSGSIDINSNPRIGTSIIIEIPI